MLKYYYCFDGNDNECIKKAEMIYDNLIFNKKKAKIIYDEKQVIDKEFPISNPLVSKEVETYLNLNTKDNVFNTNKTDDFWNKFPTLKGYYPIERKKDKPWIPISTYTYKIFIYGYVVEILEKTS